MARKKNRELATSENEGTASSEGMYVVYCKLPCGYSFPMPDGRKIFLNGSNHKEDIPNGRSLAIVGYGRTEVAIEDWEWISNRYSALRVFSEDNPIIFVAEDRSSGDEMAREVGPSVKSGMEQRTPREIIKQAERQANNPQPQE